MTSRQFIDFLESKLIDHRVRKVIPDAKGLADAFRLFARGARMKQVVEAAMAAMAKQEIAAPTNLERRVKAHLRAYPKSSWDEAVVLICARSDGKFEQNCPHGGKPPFPLDLGWRRTGQGRWR